MQKGNILIFLLVGIVVLAAIGGAFYLGRSTTPKPSPTLVATPQTPPPTSAPQRIPTSIAGSIQTCGDIPDVAFPTYGHFDVRKGPEWSADCQHIVWSMWQSGTGCPDCPPATFSGREGIFMYDAKNKTITKIYSPTKLGEAPEFIKWVDNNNLDYKADQKAYNYNLQTQKATQVIP